jgi:hypothetical protein
MYSRPEGTGDKGGFVVNLPTHLVPEKEHMRRVLSLLAVLSFVVPAAALAQTPAAVAETPSAEAARVTSAPAPISVTAAGQQALLEARVDAATDRGVPGMAPGKGFGQAEALMVIGGAAILGGVLVGGRVGYVVSVVGLGVGL